MELALIVNGEEQNAFPIMDAYLTGATAFNKSSEMTAIDQAYMALDNDPDADVRLHFRQEKKQYMTYRFDVTDLTQEQRDALAGEVCCQAEASDGHPSVPLETDYDEVTL